MAGADCFLNDLARPRAQIRPCFANFKKVSRGSFLLNVFGRKEIVPQFAITDAVRYHKIEADYTRLDFNQGKITASGLLGAVAFGAKSWGSSSG